MLRRNLRNVLKTLRRFGVVAEHPSLVYIFPFIFACAFGEGEGKGETWKMHLQTDKCVMLDVMCLGAKPGSEQ